MTAQTDLRLVDNPMQPLDCSACAATVLVRKSNWQQTTIQWQETSQKACLERPLACRGGTPTEQFAGCGTLAATIRDASLEGRIDVIFKDVPET
ncbi:MULTISPECIES: ferredoxin [Arthrobacter]|uniref:Ferredoxin n=1 Tax=Arthrobacter sunyaminii TaxID=2816859 RepID=A0A975S715_9MICC|nr:MULTISPECIES: ferredoxin [Arthrobacter]MBO0896254.1 hypothetical protein [Arthrobacter sunyaminii]MBO0907961.1 hypothetical protein [Arthrobacter sunyaminii]QWQ37007.1 hypothetical protein KG104_04215 [Arthrobacter sunyaminii]